MNDKIQEITKSLTQLKEEVTVKMEDNYINFTCALDKTNDLMNKMSNLSVQVNDVTERIDIQVNTMNLVETFQSFKFLDSGQGYLEVHIDSDFQNWVFGILQMILSQFDSSYLANYLVNHIILFPFYVRLD